MDYPINLAQIYWIVHEHCIKSIDYLIRVKVSFSATRLAFIASGKYRRRKKPKITKNQKDTIWKSLNLMTLPLGRSSLLALLIFNRQRHNQLQFLVVHGLYQLF